MVFFVVRSLHRSSRLDGLHASFNILHAGVHCSLCYPAADRQAARLPLSRFPEFACSPAIF